MTKRRKPGTVHDALNRAFGILTIARTAELLGMSEAHVRAIADPDKPKVCSLAHAAKIDKALISDGEDPVLLTWLDAQVADTGVPGYLTAVDRIQRARQEIRQAVQAVKDEESELNTHELICELACEMAESANLLRVICNLAVGQRAQQQGPKLVSGGGR